MRSKMQKKGRKKSPLPEIQEEGLADPLLHRIRSEPQSDMKEDSVPNSEGSYHPLPSNIQKAAALVDQAMQGRFMPLDVVHHHNYLSAKQAFLLYHHLSYPRCIVLVSLAMLSFFEVPEWCKGTMPNPCGDTEEYLLSGIQYLQPWVTLLIEVACLLLLAWSVALQRYFKHLSFWKNRVAVVKVGLLLALAICKCLTVFEVPWIGVLQLRKVSMYLRILIPLVFSRALRGCIRMTMRIISPFVDIVLFMLVFVLLSAWVATMILKNTYFDDYPTALLKLFVLITAANVSDVWIATHPHNLALVFLFIYLIVGIFFLTNVMFSIIYTSFKTQMVAEAKKKTTARQGSLRAAFSLLDIRQQEWIDGPTMIALFLAIGHYRHIPDIRSRASQLFLSLSKRGDFKIWSDDFEDLCDVIAKEVKRRPKAGSFSRYTVFEMMWVLGRLQFVKSQAYDYFLWLATFGSVAVAIYERNVNDVTQLKKFQNIEFGFGCYFIIDAGLKMLVLGKLIYWKSILNCFDFILALGIVSLQGFSIFYPTAIQWMSILVILRSFRAVVFVMYFPRWHLLSETLLHLIPATAPILGLQFCVCSLFSLLGVHLFQGLVFMGNPLVEGTDYATSGLWVFNYNDYASAMGASFNLCIVSNWYIIMEGYAAATGNPWSRAYFISFWLIVVSFTLNVLISFFIETYTVQLEKAKTKARQSAEQLRREAVQARSPGLSRIRPGAGQFLIFKKTVSYYNLPPRRG